MYVCLCRSASEEIWLAFPSNHGTKIELEDLKDFKDYTDKYNYKK